MDNRIVSADIEINLQEGGCRAGIEDILDLGSDILQIQVVTQHFELPHEIRAEFGEDRVDATHQTFRGLKSESRLLLMAATGIHRPSLSPFPISANTTSNNRSFWVSIAVEYAISYRW